MDSTQDTKRFAVKGKVKIISGSVINPEMAGLRFILNAVNTAGKTDSDLENLLDKKWKKVKAEVRGWFVNKTGAYKLGAVNTIAVQSDVWILNMLCKDDNLMMSEKGLEACLAEVAKLAKYEQASVHVSSFLLKEMPNAQELLNKHFSNNGILTCIYDDDALVKKT